MFGLFFAANKIKTNISSASYPSEDGMQVKNTLSTGQTAAGITHSTIPAAFDLPSPHRVVTVHDSKSSSWPGSGNAFNYMNQAEIDRMVDAGVMELTGSSSPQDAWKKIIPYKPRNSVAIKVNFNNYWHCSDGFSMSTLSMASNPQVVNSVIRGLKSIGVPSDKIWISDPSRPVADDFRNRISDSGVQYFTKCANYGPRPNIHVTGYVANDSPYATPLNTNYVVTGNVERYIRPAQVFADATYIINIPQLKGHWYTNVGGITASIKNNFGSVSLTEEDTNGENVIHDSPQFNKILADINKNPVFYNKTRLVLGDGIMGNPDINTGQPKLWKSFGKKPPRTLFFGVDLVATDSVMMDYIIKECSYGTCTHSPHKNDSVNSYAASVGLGITEHWNSDRKYKTIDYHAIDLDR